MLRLRILAAALLMAAGLSSTALAADQRPVVVELFTSQGCDSCPPADAFLGELTRRPDVLALAFHVDYWDYIGWKDPFAQRAWTERQRGYGASLGLRGIYTPQMVIDGRIDAVGSQRDQVERAIKTARATPAAVQLNLTRLAEGGVAIALTGAEGLAGEAELIAVTYDRRHETQVMRGENAGKKLVEYNVVRGAKRIDGWRGGALQRQLAAAELPGAGEQCAVLVQAKGQGAILAAATVALR
jgi:hypothetical protein